MKVISQLISATLCASFIFLSGCDTRDGIQQAAPQTLGTLETKKPSQAFLLPEAQYNCETLTITLKADGSSLLRFRCGASESVISGDEATKQAELMERVKPDNDWIGPIRLIAVVEKLPSVVASCIIHGNGSASAGEARIIAKSWVVTKVITITSPGPGFTKSSQELSDEQLDELRTALTYRPAGELQ